MRSTTIRRAVMAAGASVLALSSLAISGTQSAAEPPVSSGLREVSAGLTAGAFTITRVCENGFNGAEVDVTANIESDYLGTGTLTMDETLGWDGGRWFTIETNKGVLHGTFFPVSQATYVGSPPSSSPWGHMESWTRYDLSALIGTGQFADVQHSGTLLQTSRIYFESNEYPPADCGTEYTQPIVGPLGEPPLLSGALTFGNRGILRGSGSGTATLSPGASESQMSGTTIDEALTVNFPSVELCDLDEVCTTTTDFGQATMNTTFTTQAVGDWFAEQLGVNAGELNLVEIIGPDRDKWPGADWTLTGYVYRSGFGHEPNTPDNMLGLEREIRITAGTGTFAQVTTGVLHYFGARYTFDDPDTTATVSDPNNDLGEFLVWGFIG